MERYKRLLGVEDVFIRNDEIIIIGIPEDSDGEEHNCDEMGCNSFEHIILRGQFHFIQKGYCLDTQEVADDYDAGKE